VNRPGEREADVAEQPHISTRRPPPRPRRLSRKAIIAVAGSGTCLIAAALAYSLSEGRKAAAAKEQVRIADEKGDLLANAPKDYSDLAVKAAGGIGPPPPSGTEMPPSATPIADPTSIPPHSAPEPAVQRRQQQASAARSSKLFAESGVSRARPEPTAEASVSSAPNATSAAITRASSRPEAFLSGKSEPSVNSGRLAPPAGDHVLAAGSTISAALITGLSSDLPGQVIAQVTEDVFDSATGRTKLIPQGARLIGSYDAEPGFGQTRAQLVWTRLILPDGRAEDLDRLVATDGAGSAGLTDKVDNHWGAILRAGILSTLLGLGSAASELDKDGAIANAIRDSAGQTIGRAGDRIVEKQLNVQPTITVRPGARVRVLVSRDLILEPWND
jgi:type IV secretion system protein VirB10